MWPKLKNGLLERLSLNESWVIFFILGLVMMNFPFVNIFNKYSLLFNIPLLFLYLLVGWAISIFVIYLHIKSVDLHREGNNEDKERADAKR